MAMLISVENSRSENSEIEDLAVGSRIRELRLAHKLSLRELGAKLGISASALSQIETGKRQPSVARLHQLVSLLDAPLSAVFGESAHNPREQAPATPAGIAIQRREDAAELIVEGGVQWLRLTPEPTSGIDFLKVTYPPGKGWDEFLRHNGHETAHVLAGTLCFEIGFERHVLSAGDSVSYESTTPHRITNTGDDPAVAVWLVLNPPHE